MLRRYGHQAVFPSNSLLGDADELLRALGYPENAVRSAAAWLEGANTEEDASFRVYIISRMSAARAAV